MSFKMYCSACSILEDPINLSGPRCEVCNRTYTPVEYDFEMPVDQEEVDEEWEEAKYILEAATIDATMSQMIPRLAVYHSTYKLVSEILELDDYDNDQSMLLDRVSKELPEERRKLEALEHKLREEHPDVLRAVDKGSLLSRGFPDENKAKQVTRILMGYKPGGVSVDEEGELFKLGLLQLRKDKDTPDGDVMEVSEAGEIFHNIERPSDLDEVKVLGLRKKNHYDIKVPRWYNKDDAKSLAKAISDGSKLEKNLMYRLLVKINATPHNPPNLAALVEAEQGLIETMFEVNRDSRDAKDAWDRWARGRKRGFKKRLADPEKLSSKEYKVLQGIILKELHATIGRMRELRLIFAVTRGSKIFYYINDQEDDGKLGHLILNKWDDDRENEENDEAEG